MGWIYDLVKDSRLTPFQKECLVIADKELMEAQQQRAKLQRELEDLSIENLALWSEVRRLRHSGGSDER